jgi:hypothetical protein
MENNAGCNAAAAFLYGYFIPERYLKTTVNTQTPAIKDLIKLLKS